MIRYVSPHYIHRLVPFIVVGYCIYLAIKIVVVYYGIWDTVAKIASHDYACDFRISDILWIKI